MDMAEYTVSEKEMSDSTAGKAGALTETVGSSADFSVYSWDAAAEILQSLRDMSFAFYTLLDRMYENIPDTDDEYSEELRSDVGEAAEDYRAAEERCMNLIAVTPHA